MSVFEGRAGPGTNWVVYLAIVVFLSVLLVPLGAMIYGAKFRPQRPVDRPGPRWPRWIVGVLVMTAALTGALIGGAGRSVGGLLLAVLVTGLVAIYVLLGLEGGLPRKGPERRGGRNS
ncbi:MAG TPA: hypothetical protein VMS00_04480 [Acidimicrobiales bacterium]|nr:hypothetical protein [Acidimicrobiales bacterium]